MDVTLVNFKTKGIDKVMPTHKCTLSERQTDRVDWIDTTKGIAILLVIFGHTIGGGATIEQIVRGAIFSFHMPLFFILSCITFNLSVNNDQFVIKTEKAFCHLIIPAVALYGLKTIISIAANICSIEWKNYLAERINIFVFGSGVAVNVMNVSVPAIGIPWFLMALFLGRSLFDYLHLKLNNKQFVVTIIICTFSGVVFGKLQWLPFSFDIALAIMPFFYIGILLKAVDMEKRAVQYGCISFVVWASTLFLCFIAKKTYLELACRRYTLFPICYVTAIAGTMLINYFSIVVGKFKIAKFFTYLGRNSMYMLWVHIMDYLAKPIWNITDNNWVNSIVRIAVDVALFVLLMCLLVFVKNKKLYQ